MKILVLLVLFLSLPLTILGQTDQRDDVMGMYLDPVYASEEGFVPPFTPFTVYALLLHPTQAELSGFEFGYDFVPEGGQYSLVTALGVNPPPGIIILPPMDPFQDSWYLGLSSPLPLGPANVIISWNFMLMAPDLVMAFYLTGAESPTIPGGGPGYWNDAGVVPARIAETCWGTGSRINAFCPLDTEPVSWGTLKGLYR